MHMKLYLLHYVNNWECLLIRARVMYQVSISFALRHWFARNRVPLMQRSTAQQDR